MIGYLSGEVRLREPSSGAVVLDVGGVGYEVTVSLQTLADVPEVGERCSLWTHTHAREDVLCLYGFASLDERRMYRLLTSVPKVGPRNAITTLGGMPLAELLTCIADGEHTRLTKVQGIGKKTAEQIVLTLRDKVAPLLEAVGRDDGGEPAPVIDPGADPLYEDARAMLVALGWKAKATDKALGAVLDEIEGEAPPLDEVVRRALAQLMDR